MESYPCTFIFRHRRENLKKCSLKGLEKREDMQFFRYPQETLPLISNYVLLKMDAPVLTLNDASSGLLLIDATWRLSQKMLKQIEKETIFIPRSLPCSFRTAYPRRQDDCPDPTLGLASIEALFIAYHVLGRNCEGLLDHYFWKDSFLQLNGF